MKTITLAALLLSGCSTMTSAQFGNLVTNVLAARIANGSSYNYQQGMRDSQANWNAFQANHLEQQKQLNSRDFIFTPGGGGLANPININIREIK